MENIAEPDLIGDVLAVVGERIRPIVGAALAPNAPDGAWGRLLPAEAAAEPDPSGARLPLLALTAELDGLGHPFAATLGRGGARAAETLLDASETWAAGLEVDADHSIRIVDAAARLLRVLGEEDAAQEVAAAGASAPAVQRVESVEPESVAEVIPEPVVVTPVPAAELEPAPVPAPEGPEGHEFAVPQQSTASASSNDFTARLQRGTADLFGPRDDAEPEPELAAPEPEPTPEAEPEPEPTPAPARPSDEAPGAIAAFFAAAGVVPTTPASAARAATERHRVGANPDGEQDADRV